MAFVPLGEGLKQRLSQKTSIGHQIDAASVLQYTTDVLAELFGGEQALRAKPLYLKNRTLTITCASAALAQEIHLNQAKIVEKINEKLGKNEVDRIRYLA